MANHAERNREAAADGGSDGKAPENRGVVWKRVAVGLASVVALIGALYLGGALYLQSVLDPATLARWVEPRLEAATNRDVGLGGASVSVFPRLSLELRDLTVVDPMEGDGGSPLASVDRVRLDVRLLPLLRRRVRIHRLRIEAPTLRLRRLADGSSNYGDLVPEGEPGEEPRPSALDLQIRDLRLAGGTLVWRDGLHDREVRVEEIDGSAALESAGDRGWEASLTAVAERVSVTLGDARPLDDAEASVELTGGAARDFGRIRIDSGSLRVGRMRLGVDGTAERLREPVRRVALRFRTDSLPVDRVVASLPDSLRDRVSGEIEGTLALDLTVDGEVGPERGPEVSGRLDLRGGGLADSDRGRLAADVAGRVLLEADTIQLEQLAGRAFGGDFRAEGRLALDSLRRFDLALRGGVLLEPLLGAVGDTSGLAGSGTAAADVTVGGRMGRPATYRVRGSVSLRDARVRTAALAAPVALPEAEVLLEGTRLAWRPTTIVAGRDTLETSGSLDDLNAALVDEPGRVPVLDAVLRGRRLALDSLRGRIAPDSLRYARLAWGRLGGRKLGGRSVEELAAAAGLNRPGPLPVRGRVQVELGEFLYGPYRLTDAVGTLVLSPDRLRLADARFGAYGGRGEASLELDLGPEESTLFDLRLGVTEARGEALLEELSPLGRTLSGLLTLDFRASGRVDPRLLPQSASVEGGADLRLSDGAVRENPVTRALSRSLRLPGLSAPSFRTLVSQLRLADGRVEVQEGHLAMGSMDVRLGGNVGLDGSLGLAVLLAVPPAVLDTAGLRGLGLAGDAARRLLAGSEPLELGVRLGGTVASPTVEVDLSAVRARAAAAAGETLRERAAREAGGLLRRLLGGRDTARSDTAASDTAGARGVSADTSLPDSTRPDTAASPDTTAPPDTTAAGNQGVSGASSTEDGASPAASRADTSSPMTSPSGVSASGAGAFESEARSRRSLRRRFTAALRVPRASVAHLGRLDTTSRPSRSIISS